MIKTLVFIDSDLASSIALRYVCRLAAVVDMTIETIHVEEADSKGNPPGTGWVRRTWEKGLLEAAEMDISRLINAERASCPNIAPPRMMVGDRETEILREVEEGSYDMLVEGLLFSFDTFHFDNKLRSNLYRKMHCPLLLIKNMVDLRRIAVLVEDHTDLQTLVPTFYKLFEGAPLEYDLLRVSLQNPGRLSFKKDAHDTLESVPGDTDEMLKEAGAMIEEAGWPPRKVKMIRNVPTKIADSLQKYSLVVSCVPRQMTKKSPMLELLSRVPSAVLLCWQ